MQQVTNHHDNVPQQNQPQQKEELSQHPRKWMEYEEKEKKRNEEEEVKKGKVWINENMLGVEEIGLVQEELNELLQYMRKVVFIYVKKYISYI